MVGGPCDFSLSPSPFSLDFGTLDFGTSWLFDNMGFNWVIWVGPMTTDHIKSFKDKGRGAPLKSADHVSHCSEEPADLETQVSPCDGQVGLWQTNMPRCHEVSVIEIVPAIANLYRCVLWWLLHHESQHWTGTSENLNTCSADRIIGRHIHNREIGEKDKRGKTKELKSSHQPTFLGWVHFSVSIYGGLQIFK